MRESVRASGGTTDETTTASTARASSASAAKSWRTWIPYSSAVRLWLVSTRHCWRSVLPSNAPSTVFVLPTSMASSTGERVAAHPHTVNAEMTRSSAPAEAASAGAQELHVPREHALDAIPGAHDERARVVDVLRHTFEVALAGHPHAHLAAERIRHAPPRVAHGGEALRGMSIEPLLEAGEGGGGEEGARHRTCALDGHAGGERAHVVREVLRLRVDVHA